MKQFIGTTTRISLRLFLLASLLAGLLAVSGPTTVRAASFTVTNTNDIGAGSLRDAIDQANANPGADTITFDTLGVFATPQTILLASSLPAITDSDGLTIDGSGANVTVDGSNAVPINHSEVMRVQPNAVLNVNALTIANANNTCLNVPPACTPLGGGIISFGTLSITNSTFSNNSAGSGGGIFNIGTLSITNSTFSNNSAGSGTGGGIYSIGNLSITNSTFSNNSADIGGGGIFSQGGTLTVTNSTFSANTSLKGPAPTAGGGGIQHFGNDTLTITDSTFSDNHTGFLGAAVLNMGNGTLNVMGSTFSNNSADVDGGGIWNLGVASVTNSTFSANSPDGMFQQTGNPSSLYVLNSTLVNSDIINNGSSVIITNSLMVNSICNTRSGVSDGGGNLSYPTTACPGINADPKLLALANNGGPTQTMALDTGSAAIDAGGNSAVAALLTDQRGIGFPRVNFGTVDIGAFELQQICPAGKYDNGSGCVDASAGYYVPAPGAIAQIACQPGSYQPNTGQTVCILADPGYYVDVAAAIAQIPCASGFTSNAGAISCTPIPPSGPTCNGQAATIYVNAQGRIVGGPDNGKRYQGELEGTNGVDVILGTNGKDEIGGRRGDDVICGGAGNDEIDGGLGNDKLFGDAGKDELNGDNGNDILTGGSEADKFNGGSGADTALDFSQSQKDKKSSIESY